MTDTKNLGLGVMIQMLGGAREETARAVQNALGKRIAYVMLHADYLLLVFADATALKFWDGGQSCCESRWMTCDDAPEFDRYIGSTFIGADIVEGGNIGEGYGEHETQFLNVRTTKGVIQAVTHNEHNGYYGGFSVQASNDIGTLMEVPKPPKRPTRTRRVFIFERQERVEVEAATVEQAQAIFDDDVTQLPYTSGGWKITGSRDEEIPTDA